MGVKVPIHFKSDAVHTVSYEDLATFYACAAGYRRLDRRSSADEIFVTNVDVLPNLDNTIGAYTTSGATVNSDLISGLSFPSGIAVVPTVPEPGSLSLTLFGLVLAGLGSGGRRADR